MGTGTSVHNELVILALISFLNAYMIYISVKIDLHSTPPTQIITRFVSKEWRNLRTGWNKKEGEKTFHGGVQMSTFDRNSLERYV